jgi:rare lipoprotein A
MMEPWMGWNRRQFIAGLSLAALWSGAAAVAEEGPVPPRPVEVGLASWYGHGGQRTANGESFDANGLTAAHRSLPFHAKVRITNLRNGRSVIVRINDRGPFHHSRVIDLSPRAAHLLGMLQSGVARVRIELAPDALS